MALQLKKAQRKKAHLRLGIAAPSGGGKTAGALIVAYGLMKELYPNIPEAELWEKVAIVDTEHGSGELYVGSEIAGVRFGEYGVVPLESPFTAEKYIEALDLCENAGIEVCILDSTSHLWSGEGGLLEQQQNATRRNQNNSYMAWREITPLHNRFVERMLQSGMHVIATMRSKQEYVQEKDSNGKTIVRKLGMEPEQRKGMEFEFTTFLDVDEGHNAFGSKDRTSIFDQKTFKIDASVGRRLMKWLQSGVEVDTPAEVMAIGKASPEEAAKKVETLKAEIIDMAKELGGSSNEDLMVVIKEYHPKGNPNAITDPTKVSELHTRLSDMVALKEQELETA